MATTVILGWFAGRNLIIKISYTHNFLNNSVYFCNMYANDKCGRRLYIGHTRHKTLKRFHDTGRFELETSRIKTTRDLQEWLQLLWGGWGIQSWQILPGTGKTVYSLRRNKVCDVISVFCTFVDLIEFFLFRLVCLSVCLSVFFVQNTPSERLMEGHVLRCGKILSGRYPPPGKKC
jgi:hypothetical protein